MFWLPCLWTFDVFQLFLSEECKKKKYLTIKGIVHSKHDLSSSMEQKRKCITIVKVFHGGNQNPSNTFFCVRENFFF